TRARAARTAAATRHVSDGAVRERERHRVSGQHSRRLHHPARRAARGLGRDSISAALCGRRGLSRLGSLAPGISRASPFAESGNLADLRAKIPDSSCWFPGAFGVSFVLTQGESGPCKTVSARY